MSRYNHSCANECGDEDCGKCMKRGIIFSCPPDCTDFEPNFPVSSRHIKPKDTGDKRLVRIEGVIAGCEDILSDPSSTHIIRKCAMETAYKHIVRIMRGDE